MAKRSNDGDKKPGKGDATGGIVIKFSIGLGEHPPEPLSVQVGKAEGRDVFDHVDELLDAVANDPALPPDDGHDDDDGRGRLPDVSAN